MNYWVCGAMFGGRDDQYELFVKRGYWYCWSSSSDKTPAEVKNRFPQIQAGDRIAIKKMLGRGSTEIEIRAIGVVTDVDVSEWRVYVDWLSHFNGRRVPIHGCAGSLHGPFSLENDEWVYRVFCI
jgi:hypothetical protein